MFSFFRLWGLIFVLSLGTSAAFGGLEGDLASKWQKMKIPGAVCGNGEEYKVFIRKGDPQKLAFGFSGGGACWNANTCFGVFALTSLKPLEKFDQEEGIFSLDAKKSALSEYTHVYFPYCTGDVFMGNHEAVYGGKKVRHVGRAQVELTVKFLKENSIVDFDMASDVALYGFSAGAIGALYHVTTLDEIAPSITSKTVISDSPGLHFGTNFWHKFTNPLLKDYAAAFERMGMVFDKNDGKAAKQIPAYCKKFSQWRIAVLQSSKDFVMSTVFGNISSGAHHEAVFGPQGIYALTESTGDNCSAWVPNSTKHTFLNDDGGSGFSIGKKKALEFANDVVMDLEDRNYKGMDDSLIMEVASTPNRK